MAIENETFVFIAPTVARFLADNEIDVAEIFKKAGLPSEFRLGEEPSAKSAGTKDLATILLASAAVIAAATPVLKELIRSLSGREAVIRERRLVPVEDGKGEIVHDARGLPVLHWVDVVKGPAHDSASQAITVKGFGIEISFGDA